MDYARAPHAQHQQGITQLVIKLGLAKDAKQATIVLVVFAVVAAVGIYIFWPGGSGYEVVPQPGLEQNN